MIRQFIYLFFITQILILPLHGNPRPQVNDSLLFLSVKEGNLDLLKSQLTDFRDINHLFRKQNRTLLTYAVETGQYEIVMLLLDQGASIEVKSDNKTPLMYAARYGRPEIARSLLERGADINAVNRDRNTAFHYAAKYNNLDILKILHEEGALVNIPNEDQWTALDFSIINGKKNTEDYLRSIGCQLFDKNLPNYFDGPYVEVSESQGFRTEYLVNRRGKKGSYLEVRDIKSTADTTLFRGLKGDRNDYLLVMNPEPPPALYPEPSRVFVIGDIHGQYERMTEILIAGGVVDDKLNWTWGDGHLVFMGDILDRGEGVVEALWLIYNLEIEAKKRGGRVHLLVGNHEAMIIKNDLRYIANKYYGLTSNLEIEYSDLFSPTTLFGRWLRSRNCVEIIGNYLFIHAGISPELAGMNLEAEEINSEFRNLLNKAPAEYSETERFLISSPGPVWYRGYFKEGSGYNKISKEELDRILKQYNVSSIVVGHTEVNLIEPMMNGGIIPVNIPLADREIIGQAILIEGNMVHRIDTDRKKTRIK